MHTTAAVPPAEITIWQPRLDEDIPAALAAIYRRAADLIRKHRVRSPAQGFLLGADRPAQHLQRHIDAPTCPSRRWGTGPAGAARSARTSSRAASGLTCGRRRNPGADLHSCRWL